MALSLTLTLLFLALVAYGLQRNAHRQAGPRPPLAGSSDVTDRDLERIRAELAAAGSRRATPRQNADVYGRLVR